MEKLTPFDWQERDIQTVVAAGSALLNVSLGGGKTLMATEIMGRLGAEQVLVVAPLSTHGSWCKRIEAQGFGPARVASNSRKAEKEALADLALGEPGWFVVSPQFMVRADTSAWSVDGIIADEVHQYAEASSKGLKKILGIESIYRVALSGTPARNKFANLWGVCRFLWPERDGYGDIADSDHYRWKVQRMTARDQYTGRVNKWGDAVRVKVFEVEANPGQLISEMPAVVTHFAREKCCDAHPNGVLGALKEVQTVHETIPVTAVQKRAIREMQTQLSTMLDGEILSAEIPLSALQRVRQCVLGEPTVEWRDDEDEGRVIQEVWFDEDCKSPYLDRLKEILSQDDENFVVWTDSQKFAQVVTARLNKAGIGAVEYSGATKPGKGAWFDGYRVIVAVVSSLGTGTDGLQDACRSEVWLSRDLDSTNNEQAEGRLFRTGQDSGVRRWIFHDSEGVSSERYAEQVKKRIELNKSLKA